MNSTESCKEYRNFGYIIGSILIGLGIFPLFQNQAPNFMIIGISMPLFFISLLYPKVLFPFYSVWMKIGSILGWINTNVILIVIFCCIFTPVGVIRRLRKKDFLDRKPDPETDSYWSDYNENERNTNMKYQF
jgi:hypothetical protein